MKSTPYQHEQISQSPRVQVSYDARTQAEQRCGVIVIRLSKHQEDNTTWKKNWKVIGGEGGIRRVIVGRIPPPHMDIWSIKKAMTPNFFELPRELIKLKSSKVSLQYKRFTESAKQRRKARHQPALIRQRRPHLYPFCTVETPRGHNAQRR
jgi:hypothetical protein